MDDDFVADILGSPSPPMRSGRTGGGTAAMRRNDSMASGRELVSLRELPAQDSYNPDGSIAGSSQSSGSGGGARSSSPSGGGGRSTSMRFSATGGGGASSKHFQVAPGSINAFDAEGDAIMLGGSPKSGGYIQLEDTTTTRGGGRAGSPNSIGYGSSFATTRGNINSSGSTATSSRFANSLDQDQPGEEKKQKELHAQSLFRYALVFINFTFIVASLLMMMAGIVARENSAVKLCDRCGDLTMVSIVFGAILWLFAMFGFNWIRQRNILLLLVYVGFLLILFLVLLSTIITSAVFDAEIERKLNDEDHTQQREDSFLAQWRASVKRNDTNICQLQKRFNCSGFFFGCCRGFNHSANATDDQNSDVCFGSADNDTIPYWYSEVCPQVCDEEIYGPPKPEVCTTVVYGALRKNLGGFIVISCFSFFLVTTGIALSALARKINKRGGEASGS